MALARMQFPHNTNLFYFLKNTPTIKIPLDDISDLMLKVSNDGLITLKNKYKPTKLGIILKKIR